MGLLVRHFLDAHARRLDRPPLSLTSDAMRCLEQHDWPGNVRELEGVLLRAAVAAAGNAPLGARDLEPFLLASRREPLFREEALEGRSLDELRRELERAYLTRLYRRVRGDLQKMMEVLGVKRSYLYTWLRKVGIDIRTLRK